MVLLRRDEKFFQMFTELASRMTESARLLRKLFDEPDRVAEHAAAIKESEHQADGLVRAVVERLDSSFVTPIDREDIHLLTSRLDDVIDLIDGTARRAEMFRLGAIREPAKQLAEKIEKSADLIQVGVSQLMKPKTIGELARQLKDLEEEGDVIYRDAIGGLFDGSTEALEVIKWKEMYDKLEDTLDQCEDVGNTLESISIKNG
jgi:predicted phosphate transport protein (TIGR00153 family)